MISPRNTLRCFILIATIICVQSSVGHAQLLTELTVDITQDQEGIYTYLYTLNNSDFSGQTVNTFLLTTADGAEVTSISGPDENWIALYEIAERDRQAAFITGVSEDGTDCGVTDEFDIFPGGSATFSIVSPWGPEAQQYDIGRTVGPDEQCAFQGEVITAEILSPSIPNANQFADCDFDKDGDCDVRDIDNLAVTIADELNDLVYDLSMDGQVSSADLDLFLIQVDRFNGDTDLNGTVEFADFLQLSANFGVAADWSQGDLDANGTVEFADFLVMSSNFGQTSIAGALASVPEPADGGMLLSALVGCLVMRRKR